MRSKPFTWLLHIALGIIVLGACVTHFFGEQGEVHLRADHAESIIVNSKSSIRKLEITLFLWSFQVVYDGDNNPVDYITELRLLDRSKSAIGEHKDKIAVDEGMIRMNKPLKYHGWRFCQSDYDSDEQGVVLAYNYDPWGIGITYAGYALLFVAMVTFFCQKHTRFRALLHQSVLRQRGGLYAAGACILIVVLAVIMTKVVTPKPPLLPVLQTPLLGIHVSVIMLAYTLFAVIAVNGIVGLCVAKWREKLMHLSQVLLYPALFCLIAGIFIGAVWANLSWGRYWGWDPKETWALITMIVYAALLHAPWLRSRSNISNHTFETTYHVCSVIAFLFVLFTYFGVSYLLGGLHSYAN